MKGWELVNLGGGHAEWRRTNPAPSGPVQTYLLPPKFYDDHRARELPEEGTSRALGYRGKRVQVEMDALAYDDLLSDAQHYADAETARQMGNPGLAASARATARALAKQGRPGQPL